MDKVKTIMQFITGQKVMTDAELNELEKTDYIAFIKYVVTQKKFNIKQIYKNGNN